MVIKVIYNKKHKEKADKLHMMVKDIVQEAVDLLDMEISIVFEEDISGTQRKLPKVIVDNDIIIEGNVPDKENIIYSKQGVTDKEVIEACKSVGIHHFIQTLPKGYDTILDDKATLSAGQKQLITIAQFEDAS